MNTNIPLTCRWKFASHYCSALPSYHVAWRLVSQPPSPHKLQNGACDFADISACHSNLLSGCLLLDNNTKSSGAEFLLYVVLSNENGEFQTTMRWGLCRQKQVSQAGISNRIPQKLWDAITYPCLWCLLLATKFSIVFMLDQIYMVSTRWPCGLWSFCRLTVSFFVISEVTHHSYADFKYEVTDVKMIS